MRELGVEGVVLIEPAVHHDDRGSFNEWYRASDFSSAAGEPPFPVAQVNCSVSRRGALRGIHYADAPSPGQAKYVSCVRGAVLDVVVDLRVGSPTYRRWESVRLDGDSRTALYLPPGLGHAFLALTDDATVVYMCSSEYAPEHEHQINPLDPDIGVSWPRGIPFVLSRKDSGAMSLTEAEAAGVLPSWAAHPGG